MSIVRGDWPASGVTFKTQRGSFILDADLIARAEMTGDDFEIRRAYAKALPAEAVAYKRERLRDGSMRIRWRIIRVVTV